MGAGRFSGAAAAARAAQAVDLRLVDAFAAAAVDETQWLPALGLLADLTGCVRGELVGIDATSQMSFRFITGFDDAMHAAFARLSANGYHPAMNYRVLASVGAPDLVVLHEAHYAAAIPRLTDDCYVDFAREQGMLHGCQTTLIQGADGLVGVTATRAERDGPTTPEQRAVFAGIAPHIRSAVTIRRALRGDAIRLLTGTLDAMRRAAFLCDASARVRAMTPAAERLLSGEGLAIRGGRLCGIARQAGDALARAVARAAGAGAGVQTVATVLVPRKEARLPLILDVVPLPRRDWPLGEARVLVLARDRESRPRAAAALLESAFGLSQAEAAVALALADGQDRAGIAEARGVSLHTIRAQIRTIFLKLDMTREVELVAWINRLF